MASMIDMKGKLAIVTGATSGVGFETALGLARAGASVVIAARNPAKARQAVSAIQREAPASAVTHHLLELGRLASIKEFAAAITAEHAGIDVLVNNGAVMALPSRQVTEDGFEQQIGINYLSHFALTGHLLAPLRAASGRVVSVASLAHRSASLRLDDFQSERSYRPLAAYGRSKLAMLVFALELQRRAERHGCDIHSMAAHPGWARTNIIPNGMGQGWPQRVIRFGFDSLAQPARDGALPILFAAGAMAAEGGGYYGPNGWGETRGTPAPARIAPQAADAAAGRALWELSEKVTGVRFGPDAEAADGGQP